MNLRGTGVALVTPFNEDKSIDFDGLKNVVNHCINGGVDYLVALGTTGETVVLNAKEKQQVLDKVKEYTNGRVPLVAGFGGNNTQLIIENINSFNLEGYSAILSSSPNYNKPSQEGIFQHYKAIAQNTSLPIILYNVPSRTGQNIKAETTIRLANNFKNIIGIKEASNDMLQCMEVAKNTADDFQLISGDDIHALPIISFGGVGVISVVAQAVPKQFTTVINEALSGNYAKASEELYGILDLIKLIFEENNPAGIKAAIAHLNLSKNELRLPNVPVNKDLESRIKQFFSK
ncbi:MAG: 4-hydroxy-tetrahydrodipicolinate synthase, partial [Bacteroidetes bacterium]|nr:4-hydroxy-tetrahydrodipicolinate synthase [Bacteroidota bacterium]